MNYRGYLFSLKTDKHFRYVDRQSVLDHGQMILHASQLRPM